MLFAHLRAGVVEDQTFTIQLILDNGGSSAANQTWGAQHLRCIVFGFNNAQDLFLAVDYSNRTISGSAIGSFITNGVGKLQSGTIEWLDGKHPNAAPFTTNISGVSAVDSWYVNADNNVLYLNTDAQSVGMLNVTDNGNPANWTNPVATGSTCGQRAPPADINYTDIWWNADESGQGYNLVQSEDFIFVTFFIYGSNGAPTWYSANLGWNGVDSFTGPLKATTGTFFGSPWMPGNLTRVTAGTASFKPSSSNAYQGTLSYSATNVGSTTKAIERQTLTSIALGGKYIGGTVSTYTGCANPANNRNVNAFANLVVSHLANGSATLVFTVDNLICTLSGTLAAHGSIFTIPSATYTCSNGFSSTATFQQIRATAEGIDGHYSSPAAAGCTENTSFSAALRREN